MTISDEISAELDRLEVDGWERALALELADNVDQRGTVSAMALLRTHMIELTRENGESPASSDAVSAIRAAMLTRHPALRRTSNKRESIPRPSIKSTPRATKSAPPPNKSGARLCVDCGAPLPPHAGRGRPRIRCADRCAATTGSR